jgi:hypothetical protein
MRSAIYFLWLASAGALAAFIPSQALACSVCECGDPLFTVFTGEGATSQRAGAVSFYLDNHVESKRSGALPGEDGREENVSRETRLFANWSPLDRLTLSAEVPYRWITIQAQPEIGPNHRVRNRGLGDARLFATALLWRNQAREPSTWIEGQLMVEPPTGRSRETIDGERDPHLQVGSGSWDWGIGLSARHHFIDGAVYASLFYRIDRPGSLHYTYGDALLANIAFTSDVWRYSLLGGESELRGGTELNFRYAGKDRVDGAIYDDSGGSIAYLTPFLEFRLGSADQNHAPWLRLGMRSPLGSGGLHGDQREGLVYSAGVRFGF